MVAHDGATATKLFFQMILTTAVKEDVRHLLKEAWDVDSDDLSAKSFREKLRRVS